MSRITEDPSSESFIQCLAKITVVVVSCPLTWTWSVLWQHIVTRCAFVCSSLYMKALLLMQCPTGTPRVLHEYIVCNRM